MIETHLDRAREAVERERERVASHGEALDAFADRVAATSPTGSPETTGPAATATVAVPSGPDGCEEIRRAFVETVGEHADGDSVLEKIRAELGPDVALALGNGGKLTREVREETLAAARERRTQMEVARRALGRERESLDEAGETVDDVVAWMVEADETPLGELGFDALRRRHERLGDARDDCERVLAERQETLGAATGADGTVGLPHRRLVADLYADLPVDYPVLATVTRLYDVCGECRRAVRAHLVYRG